MTIEQIELRRILTQMLADNGINRETILDFTKEIINEKVDKAVKVALNETNLDNMVYSMVNREIGNSVRSEVSSKVHQAFNTIHVTVECSSDKDKNAVEV